jgi:hypothetical protein
VEATEPTLPGDVNGDGFTDLVVAAPGELAAGSPWRGALTVLRGDKAVGISGLGSDWISRQQTVGTVGSSASQCWASNLALGDFNRDGFGDVVVADPCEGGLDPSSTSLGSIVVVFGSSSGLRRWDNQRITWRDLGIAEPGGQSRIGALTAVGDLTGDGTDDLVLAAGDQRETGMWIVPGRAGIAGGGLVLSAVQAFPESPSTLAVGDLNADGRDDLVLLDAGTGGAPGTVSVRMGGAGASGALGPVVAVGPLPSGVSGTDPARLAVGDFNGDGRDDVAMSGRDAIAVLGGTETGLAATPTTIPEQDATSLAVGDFNQDGKDDLAAGRPHGMDGGQVAGLVDVLYGSISGLWTIGKQTWGQATPGVPGAAEEGDGFGSTLFAGTFGRTKHDDLAIGIGGENDASGALLVLYGSTAKLTTLRARALSQNSTGIRGAGEQNDGWGRLPH